MSVINTLNQIGQTLYSNNTSKSNKSTGSAANTGEAKETATTEKSDVVNISSASKEMNIAKATATSVSDIRQEIVDKIKSAVDSGNYKVDAEKIAEKMIEFNISDIV